VRTEPRATKRGDDLESRPLEHRSGPVCRLISESVRLPPGNGISLHEALALLLYRFKSGLQRRTRHAAFTIFLKNGKTSDSPKLVCRAIERETSVLTTVVDSGQLVAWAVLTPSDGLTFRVDENSVSAALVEEFSFFRRFLIPRSALVRNHLLLGNPQGR